MKRIAVVLALVLSSLGLALGPLSNDVMPGRAKFAGRGSA